MSDDRVTAFRDAVRLDDTAAAIGQFDEFDAALDDYKARESAVREVARGLLSRSSQNPNAAETAKSYLEAVAEAQQARLQAKHDFLLYLKGGPSGSAVADKVETVVSANESVRKQEVAMRQNAGDIALPTSVQVTGPNVRTVPVGESLRIEYEVANVGLRGVSDLSVDVEGLDATPEQSAIDSLSAGTETTVTVTGTPKTGDEATLKVSIGDSKARTRIVPLDKTEYVDRIRMQFEETKSAVDDAASLSRRTIGDDGQKPGESRNLFSKGGLEANLQATVENGRLTLREKVNAKKRVQLRSTVNVHPAATPEQEVAAHLSTGETFLGLARRALDEGKSSLANDLLREFVSALESAGDALDDSPSDTGKSKEKKRNIDDEAASQRQLTIWSQDLDEIGAIATTALRIQT